MSETAEPNQRSDLGSAEIQPQALFDAVTAKAGRPPQFWGRYIGRTGNLTVEEMRFLHQRNCKVLLIDRGTTVERLVTYQNGVDAATHVISGEPRFSATALGVPAGVWIYADIEADAKLTADFICGWSDTMAASIYHRGFYCNTAVPNFTTPYCAAYNDPRETHMRGVSLLWTTQPNQACNWGTAANPPFAPIIPSCPPAPPPSVVIQQYSSGRGHVCLIGRTEVDLDSANAEGFASMW